MLNRVVLLLFLKTAELRHGFAFFKKISFRD